MRHTKYDHLQDEELIEEYHDGDLEAFEYLIHRYTNSIYFFVHRMTGSPEDSRDITQDIFVKIWKNLKKFDNSRKFKTWIYTISRNTAFDWLRKKHDVVASSLDTDEIFIDSIIDTGPLPDEIFEKKELDELVGKALLLLTPNNRSVLILKHTEELTFEEIAIILDEPMNTVKSRYRRSLHILKKHLLKCTK